MPDSLRFPLLPYLVACAVALLALTAFWYELGKPVNLPDAATPTHRLECASYSPFDKDQSPYDDPLMLRPARIDADLALLATRFTCVRTYSMTGLEDIPQLARQHGLQLMLGAWVNGNPRDTRRELDKLIAAANANPDVVKAVVVGNEVLLRKELTGAQLAALVRQVKARVSQPVTYADVWEFWLRHPEVAPAVDFVTLHLLPYWEDRPSGIDQALEHVAEIREAFARRFPDKDIFIGETGWPSEGRQRDTAVPSPVNQATFIRGFIGLAERHGWHYNLIEAFDQPWKRANEGAVGGYWGLFDADRQEKPVLAGPVSNLARWPFWLAWSLLLTGASLLLAGRPGSPRAAALLPLLGAFGGACTGLWGELSWLSCRFAGEWLWAALLLGLNLLVLAQAVLTLSALSGWRARLHAWLQAHGNWWLMASGFAGAVMALALVFDARYRSFPTAALLLPALFHLLRPAPVPRREAALLAMLVGLGIVPQLVEEGLRNGQALGWTAVSALLAAALWRSRQATAPTAGGALR
jgi:exo-beta-1,3-glucanase (GH17 family)